MTFEFKPAVRENVKLLIGLAGASGAGKTKSALELATGLSPSGKIGFLDTEARRGLHYASEYRFFHSDMRPPFGPERFTDGIKSAEDAGMEVCIIDSASHEYDGEGGIMELADQLAEGTPKPGIENPRKPSEPDGWRDWLVKPVTSPGNWKEPKLAHKKMMNSLLQARCHIIFCLRADEKIRIMKPGDEMPDGSKARKTEIIPMGWVPICEKRFMFEMTLSLTLRPDDPGKPQFDLPHKMQDQHRHMFPRGEFITREAGRLMAEWAAGAEPQKAGPSAVDLYGIELKARIEAGDKIALAKWWSETEPRRNELQIPAARFAKMEAAANQAVGD